jgi:hypothetical protein
VSHHATLDFGRSLTIGNQEIDYRSCSSYMQSSNKTAISACSADIMKPALPDQPYTVCACFKPMLMMGCANNCIQQGLNFFIFKVLSDSSLYFNTNLLLLCNDSMSLVKTNGTVRAYKFIAVFTEEFYFL